MMDKPIKRCRVGDIVMIIRAKDKSLLGRIGVISCTGPEGSVNARPDEAKQVTQRDWVVCLVGAPHVFYREGNLYLAELIACRDKGLMPIRPEDRSDISVVAVQPVKGGLHA